MVLLGGWLPSQWDLSFWTNIRVSDSKQNCCWNRNNGGNVKLGGWNLLPSVKEKNVWVNFTNLFLSSCEYSGEFLTVRGHVWHRRRKNVLRIFSQMSSLRSKLPLPKALSMRQRVIKYLIHYQQFFWKVSTSRISSLLECVTKGKTDLQIYWSIIICFPNSLNGVNDPCIYMWLNEVLLLVPMMRNS